MAFFSVLNVILQFSIAACLAKGSIIDVTAVRLLSSVALYVNFLPAFLPALGNSHVVANGRKIFIELYL